MRTDVQELIEQVSQFDGVDTGSHRFGGTEFTFGKVEIGHVHSNGMVDIPFTRTLRAQLVADGEAEVHHLLDESGWISFYLGRTGTVDDAVRLFRLSYLQKTGRRRQISNMQAELDALAFSPPINAVLLGSGRSVT